VKTEKKLLHLRREGERRPLLFQELLEGKEKVPHSLVALGRRKVRFSPDMET
jgi:hypothetical protein